MKDLIFPPKRLYALDRLKSFLPHAAQDYARGRNSDFGPNQPTAVSKLSPYIRYRMISEKEIIARIYSKHAPKFGAEIYRRNLMAHILEGVARIPSEFMGFLLRMSLLGKKISRSSEC